MPQSVIFISSVEHRGAHDLVVRKDDQMCSIFWCEELRTFLITTRAETMHFVSVFNFDLFYDIIAHRCLYSVQSSVVWWQIQAIILFLSKNVFVLNCFLFVFISHHQPLKSPGGNLTIGAFSVPISLWYHPHFILLLNQRICFSWILSLWPSPSVIQQMPKIQTKAGSF